MKTIKTIKTILMENNNKEYKEFEKSLLKTYGFTKISQMDENQQKMFKKIIDKAWTDRLRMHTNV